jgi:hypothetical protein
VSTQEQARALMTRHQHSSKNRQQAMLNRAAAEMGVNLDNGDQSVKSTRKN